MSWLDEMERLDGAYPSYPDMRANDCCPGSFVWFDRVLCAPPCGKMHERCMGCGRTIDGCEFE